MPSPEQDYARFRDRGDVQALAAVFDALAPELLLVAAHLTRDGAAAEDLVQATFVDAITKAAQWDAQRPLLPWLLGILTNHARVRYRRGRREDCTRTMPDRATHQTPRVAAEQREVADAIASGLREVPNPLRQALVLRLVHELSPTQIAHALACPVATVKTRLRRGLQALRRLLPRGLVGGLVMVLCGRSGLAALRQQVVEHARTRGLPARRAIGPGTAAGLAAGAASKKILAAVAVLALATLALFTLPTPTNAPPKERDDRPAAAMNGALAATAVETGETAPAPPREEAPVPTSGPTGGTDFEFLWEGTDLPARHLQVWWREAVEGPTRLHRCFADGDGKLCLRDLPVGELVVFNLSFQHRWCVRPGPASSVRVEVKPGHVVTGSVVGPDGRGIGNARVFVQGFNVGEDARPRLVAHSAADGSFVARTDRGGSLWSVAAGHSPSACETVSASGHVADLRLVVHPTTGSLTGIVRRSDGAIAGSARLTIVRTDGSATNHAPIVLQADASGRFATRELASGRHLVVAELTGHAPTPRICAIEDGRHHEMQIQLGAGASLRGVVRASDREPLQALLWFRLSLPGIAVGDRRALSTIRQAFERMCSSGTDGTYHIDGLPAGTVAIEVASATTARVHLAIDLSEGGGNDLDIVVPRGQCLAGRVVALDGAPLAGWNVFVHAASELLPQSGRTDANGAFTVQGIDADRCHVTASPPGDDSGLPVHLVDVALDGTEVVLRAHPLADAGRLTGSLDLALGQPANGWHLQVRPRGFPDFAIRNHTLRGTGPFEIHRLAPGAYEVALARGDWLRPLVPVEILSTKATHLGSLQPDLAEGR